MLRNQYNVFQLGWFPDYPDSENYLVPFYRNGLLHRRRLQQPGDGERSSRRSSARRRFAQRIKVIKQIQLLAAKDVPIVPYWQQSMIAVGRNNVRGIPSTLDPTVLMRFWQLSKS